MNTRQGKARGKEEHGARRNTWLGGTRGKEKHVEMRNISPCGTLGKMNKWQKGTLDMEEPIT